MIGHGAVAVLQSVVAVGGAKIFKCNIMHNAYDIQRNRVEEFLFKGQFI